jgi:hypothetical protein
MAHCMQSSTHRCLVCQPHPNGMHLQYTRAGRHAAARAGRWVRAAEDTCIASPNYASNSCSPPLIAPAWPRAHLCSPTPTPTCALKTPAPRPSGGLRRCAAAGALLAARPHRLMHLQSPHPPGRHLGHERSRAAAAARAGRAALLDCAANPPACPPAAQALLPGAHGGCPAVVDQVPAQNRHHQRQVDSGRESSVAQMAPRSKKLLRVLLLRGTESPLPA